MVQALELMANHSVLIMCIAAAAAIPVHKNLCKGEERWETKKIGIDYWKQIVVVMSLGWVAIWIYRTVLTPIYPEIPRPM